MDRLNTSTSFDSSGRRAALLRRPVAFLFVLLSCPVATCQDELRPSYGQAASPAGIGRYEPGTWGVVAVQLANPADTSVEVLPVLSFQEDSNVQFGRKVWIPPRARRMTWYPVRTPKEAPLKNRPWQVHSLLFDPNSESDAPIPARGGEMQIENILPMGRGRALTALIVDDENEDAVRELIWGVRLTRNYRKTYSTLDVRRLPPTVDSLDGLDQLVVASDQVFADTAACTAIREWVHRGGNLWVMLDLVNPDLISRLAGDACQVSVVDSVGRTRLQFYSHDTRGRQPSGDERRFDHPVEMVRAVFSGFRSSHTVDDWPAAAWTDVGRGNLLVTTVGSRAWLRPKTPLDQLPEIGGESNGSVLFVATEPLQQVAFEFLAEQESAPLEPGDFEQVVSEQIGYRIVSRGNVGAFLGVFCAGLSLVGGFLWLRGRLEHLGWLGPLAVAVTSVLLLGVGRASRESVPKTVVVTQFAETSPFTDEIQVTGLAATYSAEKSTDPLGADNGGLLTPILDDHRGTVLRMISTDREKWQLHNLVVPAGQQLVPFSNSYRLEAPVAATATFGPAGVSGVIAAGPFEDIADAVLALPSTKNMALQLADGGQFTSNVNEVLAPGQFLSGGVLSDEQCRRRDIFQMMFTVDPDQRPYPTRPTLLVWAEPLDLGLHILEGVEQTGSALVSIPLQLTPPPPETQVVIPAPFMEYRAVGAETSTTYDYRKRQWSGPFPKGLDTVLQFQLPQVVLPIRLQSATLTVDIKAPARELQITGLVDGEFVVLESRNSPLGLLEFSINREDVLELNGDGELTLGINVGDARDDENSQLLDPSQAQTWKIEELQLQVTGVTLAH